MESQCAYYKPKTLKEAVRLLGDRKRNNVILAGGSFLALTNRSTLEGLVDITGLGLRGIRETKTAFVIGATTTMKDLQESRPLGRFAGGILAAAAANYSTTLVRNTATLGGVLIEATGFADVVAALLAFDTRLRIVGKKERMVSLDEFCAGNPFELLGKGIIKEIRVIKPKGKVWAGYERLAKTKADISIISVSASVQKTGQKVGVARIVAGGVDLAPVRFRAAEQIIVEGGLDERTIAKAAAAAKQECPVTDDLRASGEYRQWMCEVLVRRVLSKLR
ncbi:MAG: FAD binding domain-containing protein [bacterium]